jgi:hypothetical protein
MAEHIDIYMQEVAHITTSVIVLQIQLTFLLALSLVGHFPHPHYKLSGVSLSFFQLHQILLGQIDDDDVSVAVVVAAAALVVVVVVVFVVAVVVVAAAVACVSF